MFETMNYTYSKLNKIILNLKFGFLCSKFHILNVGTKSLTFIFIYIIHFRYAEKQWLGVRVGGWQGLVIYCKMSRRKETFLSYEYFTCLFFLILRNTKVHHSLYLF